MYNSIYHAHHTYREMTGEVILVILSLAGMIFAQTDCPPRGMNDSAHTDVHLHTTAEV